MPSKLFGLLLFLALMAVGPLQPVSAADPQFRLGFRTLADLIPDVAGVPLEEEHYHPVNGDSLQVTTVGLMVWRKSDNWTAFTNGFWTWINGPLGLQERANEERFEWEVAPPAKTPAEAATPAATPPAPMATGAPAPLATDAPTPTSTEVPIPTATEPAAPTAEPTAFVAPTETPRLLPSATPAPTATSARAPTSTRVPTVPAGPTAIPGGTLSPDPAGDWVTSITSSTVYYTSRENSSRWGEWAADRRVWFATEAALKAAYPDRIKWSPPATSTLGPAATPTKTPTPPRTLTPSRTSTPSAVTGGIRSADPAGEWVTSVAANTVYYTTRANSSVWLGWSASNRIWFNSEADLLRAYPGRTRK